MPEHIEYDEQDLYNAETHHEQSDVPIRPLWWAVIVFIAFAIFSHVVLWFYFKALVKSERERSSAPRTLVQRPANLNVPQNQPLLQPFPQTDAQNAEVPPYRTTPVVDLLQMRAAEQKALTSYGWVDRQKGTVHVPIDLAKEMFVARTAVAGQTGAPSMAGQPAAALEDAMVPAGSGNAPATPAATPAGTATTPATTTAPGTTAPTTSGGSHR